MKQQYIFKKEQVMKKSFKEKEAELKEKQIIRKKLEVLKESWKELKYNKIGLMFKILNKYVELKKKENWRFTPRSLEWEKGFGLKEWDIRTIFSYAYLNDRALKLIKEGKIKDFTICKALARFKLLREPQWQELLLDKLLKDGQFGVTELAELNIKQVKDYLLGKSNFYKADGDRIVLTWSKNIRSLKARLVKREQVLKNSPYLKSFKQGVGALYKYLHELGNKK